MKRVLFLVRFLQTDKQLAQNLVRIITLAQLIPELLDPLAIKNNRPNVGRPTLGHRRQLMQADVFEGHSVAGHSLSVVYWRARIFAEAHA